MKLVEVKGDELKSYDLFIRECPNGDILQSPNWSKVKEEWQTSFLAIKDGGNYIGTATVMMRKAPYINKKFMYIPRGPVFIDHNCKETWNFFTKEIKKFAKDNGCIFVKIDPAVEENPEINNILDKLGYKSVRKREGFGGTQPQSTIRQNIDISEDELLASMPKKTRYNVKYPSKKGVEFKHLDYKGLEDFQSIMDATSSRAKFIGRQYEYYKTLLEKLGDDASLIIAYFEGVPIAGGITLAYGDKAWAMYGGAANVHTNLKAYYGLNYERMLWAKGRGAKYFDFFGIPVHRKEGDKLYGLYKFKKSFGGEEYSYVGEYDLVASKAYYTMWDLGKRWVKFLRKRKK